MSVNRQAKIGIVSNFFPPVIFGGYEIGCGQVARALEAKGWEVSVLTTRHLASNCTDAFRVWRVLHCNMGTRPELYGWVKRSMHLLAFELKNQRLLDKFIRHERPDVLYFWNLGHTSRSLIAKSQSYGIPCGVFLGDCSLIDRSVDKWYCWTVEVTNRLATSIYRKALVAAGTGVGIGDSKQLDFSFAHYHTDFVCDQHKKWGVKSRQWIKTGWGVCARKYLPGVGDRRDILFVGQVARHKGVHVAIKAMQCLEKVFGVKDLKLTIVGRCSDMSYDAELRALSVQCGGNRVVFSGHVSDADLPRIYSVHGILIFPSIWDEPMGAVILEAMASGLAIVSSGRGGSRELTMDGKDGYVYCGDDGLDCARKLYDLINDPLQCKAMQVSARKRVEEAYQFDQTIEKINQNLSCVVNAGLGKYENRI